MKPIGNLMSSFLNAYSSDPERTLWFLEELWPDLVGEEVARQTTPLRLDRKCLHVEVRDPVWADQVHGLQALLIRAINNYWQTALVERIRFQMHPSQGDRRA